MEKAKSKIKELLTQGVVEKVTDNEIKTLLIVLKLNGERTRFYIDMQMANVVIEILFT